MQLQCTNEQCQTHNTKSTVGYETNRSLEQPHSMGTAKRSFLVNEFKAVKS